MLERVRELFHKLRDLDYSHPWQLWGLFYCILILAACLAAGSVFFFFPTYNIDVENARYLLSSSIQIEAAILAIVFSLTLIAVQTTATGYSSRVNEVFKRHPNMWFLLGLYISSITLGSILLLVINTQILESPEFKQKIYFTISLQIGSLIALFPYYYNTLNLLNSESILKRLGKFITAGNIKPGVDPFQSLFDIIYGAIRNNDLTTINSGFRLSTGKFVELMTPKIDEKDEEYITSRFFNDLKRCGFLLNEKHEVEMTSELISYLLDICEWGIESNNTTITTTAITTIRDIGKNAIEKNCDHCIPAVYQTLQRLGEYAITCGSTIPDRNNSQILSKITDSIIFIGMDSVKSKTLGGTASFFDCYNKLKDYTVSTDIRYEEGLFSKQLSSIGIEAINNSNESAFTRVVSLIGNIAIINFEQNEKETDIALDELKKLGKYLGKQNREKLYFEVIDEIEYITTIAKEKKLKDIAHKSIVTMTKLRVLFPALRNRGFSVDYERRIMTDEEFDLEVQQTYAEFDSKYETIDEFDPSDENYVIID